MKDGRWTEVTTSAHTHERAGLDYLRRNLPDRDPYRAWSNFTFIGDDGSLNEVDCLVVTPSKVWLVEIKSYPGKLEGDAGIWQWTPPDSDRALPRDNPLPTANLKSKRLKSLLRGTSAFSDGRLRNNIPWFQPVVFLSDPSLTCMLDEGARQHVYGVDPEEGERVPDHALPGIIEALTEVDPRRGSQVGRPMSQAVSKAMEQAGIRETVAHRQVGPYELGDILAEGEGWQDYLARHTQVGGPDRRLRLYLTGRATSEEERERLERAARREFRFLQAIDHPQIHKPLHFESHDRGPALVFEHDPDATRLDHYLREHAGNLSRDDRIGLVRSLAEALRHAHHKGLYHRALTPEAVMVSRSDDAPPLVTVRNWQTATREPNTTATSVVASGTQHVSQLVGKPAQLYLAPETRQLLTTDPRAADLFSLGALSILILTGKPPAADLDGLQTLLTESGHLTLAAAADGADSDLDVIMQDLTKAKASERLVSVDEFLEYLDVATRRDQSGPAEDEVDPLHAEPGDMIGDVWMVERRFATGSTGVVLQVLSDEGPTEVLKVARDADAADRIRGEHEVLSRQGLRDRRIIEAKGLDEIGGRTVLRLEAALRTLSRELEDHGRVGLDLLERWGSDLIEGLNVLEEEGVAHRDIKPDNLGIIERGKNDERHLVLFDFSLSKADPTDLRAGTKGYVDPFLSARAGKRWDIHAERYAAAVTLYEMATGALPRWGDGSTAPEFVDDELPEMDLDLFDVAVASELEEFFARGLHREPRERFGTASAMLRAWRAVFAGLRARSPEDEDAGKAAQDVDLTTASKDTLIAELGLTSRLASALERLDVTTLDDLRAIPQQRLISLPSIGAATRREITHLASRVRERFSDARAPASADGHLSIDQIADVLVPKPPADVDDRTTTSAFLGLLDGTGQVDWPSQRHVVDVTSLTSDTVAAAVTAARQRWTRRVELTMVRNELVELLHDRAGVASGVELAAALLAAHGSTSEGATRHARARAIIRAAVEAERTLTTPKFVARRVGERLLVALDGTHAGRDEAQPKDFDAEQLIDSAAALGEKADEIVGQDPLPTPDEVVAQLREVELPDETLTVTDARLVRLAAAAAASAAVSSRLELYPVGLAPGRAVQVARASLIDRSGLTVDEVHKRIEARFPRSEPLPGRPTLDRLLEQAETGLVFDRATDRYVLQLHEGLGLSSISTPTATTYPSTDFRETQVDALTQRLERLEEMGGYLVLTVHPRRLHAAVDRIAKVLAADVVDLDAALIEQMREGSDAAGASWEAFLKADAEWPTGRGAGPLRALIRQAVEAVEQRLKQASRPAVLTNIGLLPRYHHLDLLDRLAAAVTREGDGQLHALTVVVPGDDPRALPVIDGEAIPVLGANQWAHVPHAWLQPSKDAA